MVDLAREFDAYLRAKLDEYIQEVSQLCAQPSISARQEGVLECAELVAQTLQKHGFRAQKYETPGNPVIVGRASGRSARTLLFYNHYDVQPPEPLDLWTTPPFQPTIRDGLLYARGAQDDKGEFVARLAAVDAVRSAYSGELPCNVIFVVEGEEEIGSPHIATFALQNKEALICQGAIWEEGGIDKDGSPYNVLGGRGALSVELTVQTMKRDQHSGGAHMFPSAAWRLVRVLESLKGADERIRIEGFYEAVRPPTKLDLELTDALPTREEQFRELLGIREFVLGRTGKELNRAVFEPTCNIQGIQTGYQDKGAKTIVPARASAKLDFRLVPDQDPNDILQKLRQHLDTQGFTDVGIAQLGGAIWPVKWSAENPLVRLAARAGEEVYDLPTRIYPLIGGSSPVYAFTNSLGAIPVILAGVGYWDNRQHAPDEHVRLVDFLNAARHIARILDGFADLSERNGQ
ncbi:MAG TPA: M20/M25/M40 family metallo-hydrolase [Anaerolineales bacterium]|nr:M20/M25/M40 family metallo-hydrolase [Anaerolineales bacterium]